MRKTSQHHLSNLTGYQQVEKDYTGQTITDNFRVARKIDSAEDGECNCYDWYEIDRHYRTIDKTPALKQAEEKNAANIDYLSMMMDVELPGGENNAQQEV